MMRNSFQNILSPVDFDENSLAALRTAGELARLAKARLFVLHVVTPPPSAKASTQLDESIAQEEVAKERLAAICRERVPDLPYEVLTRTRAPAICIIRAGEELNADLIVIAAHASRRKPRAFPESVAERIIRESTCPVVTVRPGTSGDPDAVGTHMTAVPATISPDLTIEHVRQLMTHDRVRWLPVVENHHVVGIISDRDVLSSNQTSETTVGALMSREVVSVSPRTSIQEAARRLVECEVDGLPVLEDGKLAGVITRSDILKAFADVDTAPPSGPRRVLLRKPRTVSH